MKRIGYRNIAKEAGVSSKTLYRVLNREPGVRDETRRKVMEALNRNGQFDFRYSGILNAVIIARETNYLSLRVLELIKLLSPDISCSVFTPQASGMNFTRAVENAGVVIYYENLSGEMEREIRSMNPDVRIINIFGDGGNVSIQIDEVKLGETAAKYFLDMGHRRIGMILNREQTRTTEVRRIWAFRCCCMQECPNVEFHEIQIERPEELEEYVRKGDFPSAVWSPRWFEANYFRSYLEKYGYEIPKDVSLLSTDFPSEIPVNRVEDLDCVYFRTSQVTELIQYSVFRMPLLKTAGHVTITSDIALKIRGSVRKLEKGC